MRNPSHSLAVFVTLAVLTTAVRGDVQAPRAAPSEPPVTWGFVAGQVLDSSGVGVKDATVELWSRDALVLSTTSGPHGIWELHMVPAGQYVARVLDPEGGELASPPLQIAAGAVQCQDFVAAREITPPLRQGRSPQRR